MTMSCDGKVSVEPVCTWRGYKSRGDEEALVHVLQYRCIRVQADDTTEPREVEGKELGEAALLDHFLCKVLDFD